MTDYTLDAAPDQLNTAAKQGWITETTANPEPGDLWLLSWDGAPQGLILVTVTRPDYVLGLPVTLGTEYASPQEALLDPTVLGTPTTVWFNAETGLGMFLLHRRVLSGAVSASDVASYRRAGKTEDAPPFPIGSGRSENSTEYRLELLSHYQALCFLEWPEPVPGEGTLNVDALAAHGITSDHFVELSGLPIEVAYEVWTGQRVVTSEIAAELSENLGLPPADLLKAATDDTVRYLEAPLLKELIFLACLETGRPEREIRNAARSSYALAARTSNVTGREVSALTDAINALRPSTEQ